MAMATSSANGRHWRLPRRSTRSAGRSSMSQLDVRAPTTTRQLHSLYSECLTSAALVLPQQGPRVVVRGRKEATTCPSRLRISLQPPSERVASHREEREVEERRETRCEAKRVFTHNRRARRISPFSSHLVPSLCRRERSHPLIGGVTCVCRCIESERYG